ncbi:MAG: hypothetical protein C4519_08175 [Desulfobacteraceae bacterium]|nr:MAG: hypothetical protein C4519_08175 [Desulfobacteraceae bacterium]
MILGVITQIATAATSKRMQVTTTMDHPMESPVRLLIHSPLFLRKIPKIVPRKISRTMCNVCHSSRAALATISVSIRFRRKLAWV